MKTMNIGMVGLDTSHCPAFVKLLNNADDPYHVAGAHVSRAFPGGSQTFSNSRNRVGQFTEELRAAGIEIADSIEALAGMDAYCLESVDGKQHLEQFKVLAKFGKPVFIDKPLACSYDDARSIMRLADESGVPLMSCSAIRYAKGIAGLTDDGAAVKGMDAFGPMALLPDYRDYFWYGIHSAEVLYSYMGKGCRTVRAFSTEVDDVIVGLWDDGRIGTLRGNRAGSYNFGCTLVTDKGHRAGEASSEVPFYALMLKKIVPFFETGGSPIDPAETLEVIAFLEAASTSRAQGGEAVEL